MRFSKIPSSIDIIRDVPGIFKNACNGVSLVKILVKERYVHLSLYKAVRKFEKTPGIINTFWMTRV